MKTTPLFYNFLFIPILIVLLGIPSLSFADNHVNDIIDDFLETEYLTQTVGLNTADFFQQNNCPDAHTEHLDENWYLQRLNRSDSIDHHAVPNLVDISSKIKTKNQKSMCLEEATAKNLYFMLEDAKTQGLDIVVLSGYRSYSDQEYLYDKYSHNNQTYHRVAHPGHSEHHLGTTIDIAGLSAGYLGGSAFAHSPEGKWIKENGHLYGFIMSYPANKEYLTGYQSEPWHWRYVGVKNASFLNILEHTLAFNGSQSISHSHYHAPSTGVIGG